MHKCTMAISPGYNLMHVSATLGYYLQYMGGSPVVLRPDNFYKNVSLFTWMVATSLLPGWWPCLPPAWWSPRPVRRIRRGPARTWRPRTCARPSPQGRTPRTRNQTKHKTRNNHENVWKLGRYTECKTATSFEQRIIKMNGSWVGVQNVKQQSVSNEESCKCMEAG